MKRITPLLIIVFVFFFCGITVAQEEGFVSLFDGKTLKGWRGKKGFWTVENGAIVGKTPKKNH